MRVLLRVVGLEPRFVNKLLLAMGAAIFLTVSLVSEAAPDQQILPGSNDNNNYQEVSLRLQNVNQDSPDGSMSISGGWRRDLK